MIFIGDQTPRYKMFKIQEMVNMIVKNTVLFFFVLAMGCGNSASTASASARSTTPVTAPKPGIKTGAENTTIWLPHLKGKQVGLVANQSSILTQNDNGAPVHLVDFMIREGISLRAIFAPEHGFRGTADAGELIKDGKDLKTGLPIVSLYGNNKKPKPEQLNGIDVMVFDLQDVGARFYTYISSLHYVMEACAEAKIPLVILDRPNPNGAIVDGPILEPEFSSFVGMHPIPVLHGMTIGEYARMINGEGWLKDLITCDLTVVPCLNYKHEMPYVLPVKPSPNLPNAKSINLYASLCFFEGTNVSVGRGTSKQFQVYGSPFLPKKGYSFVPKPNEGAKDPMHNGKTCYGEDLSNATEVTRLEIKWLLKAYAETEDKSNFFNNFFVKLAGTRTLQQQIESGMPEEKIRQSWAPGLTKFKKIRKVYELY